MRFSHATLVGAVLAFTPTIANAQAQVSGTRFGVEAVLGSRSSGFGVGGFVKFHLTDLSEHPITGRVSFDYFFGGSSGLDSYNCVHYLACDGTSSYFEVAADGLYDIANSSSNIKPYVGAGLTYAHASYTCAGVGCPGNLGLDILGGINFMGNSHLMPFVEVKDEIRTGGFFVIRGGIHLK